jgi:hypothetical protein
MLWRHPCYQVRAWSAAVLYGGLFMLAPLQALAQSPRLDDSEPTAAPAQSPRLDDSEPTAAPAEVVTQTVDLLKASKSGELSVVAHGQGQDRALLLIRNTSQKRLHVILPAGLVASAATGQGRGMQSLGLGAISNRPGSFGQFSSTSPEGLHSVKVEAAAYKSTVTVPIGETLAVSLPSVCLNYGLPTPTPQDTLSLMDVNDYTADPRVRKGLRSLCLLGTSQGVAQAVMWRLCNDLPFETMATQGGKVMNQAEIALAARFVDVLDATTGSDLVGPAALSEGRLFVRIQAEGALAKDAQRLNDQLDGYRLLGLPVRVVHNGELPAATAPALYIKVILTDSKIGETRGRISVSHCAVPDQWAPLGKATFLDATSLEVLDGQAMSRALDRAIAAAFVSVKPARRTVGSTTLKLDNHLPFTLVSAQVKAGSSAGAPSVPFEGLGVGPARSLLLPIQAATGTIERVELNGL